MQALLGQSWVEGQQNILQYKKTHETSCSPRMGIWNFLLSKVCVITVRVWEYQKLLKNMEKKILSTLPGERVGQEWVPETDPIAS